MRKSYLFELIREINQFSPQEKLVIAGSQAAHATEAILPEIAKKSIECDFIFGAGKSEIREAISKRFGVFSKFQDERGFYADPLGLATVVLPTDWHKRLQPLRDENDQIVAHCVEIHDVAVSKLVAGRGKDHEFLASILASEIIDVNEFLKRTLLVRSSVENDVLAERLTRLIEFLRTRRDHETDIEAIRDFLREQKDSI